MLLYRIFIWLYPKAAWLLSFSNPKAGLWTKGRKELFKELALAFHKKTKPVIWMHCSSLGEFEQGLPILEKLKQHYPFLEVVHFVWSDFLYNVFVKKDKKP